MAVTFIAFNTVNHEILFERLCHNGVRGIALDLMKSYQNLKINSVHSFWSRCVTRFCIGITIISCLYKWYVWKWYTYADDPVVLSIENSWSEVENKIREYLSKLNDWFMDNKLTINIKRTAFLIFGCYSDSVPESINIRVNNLSISRKESLICDNFLDYKLK